MESGSRHQLDELGQGEDEKMIRNKIFRINHAYPVTDN